MVTTQSKLPLPTTPTIPTPSPSMPSYARATSALIPETPAAVPAPSALPAPTGSPRLHPSTDGSKSPYSRPSSSASSTASAPRINKAKRGAVPGAAPGSRAAKAGGVQSGAGNKSASAGTGKALGSSNAINSSATGGGKKAKASSGKNPSPPSSHLSALASPFHFNPSAPAFSFTPSPVSSPTLPESLSPLAPSFEPSTPSPAPSTPDIAQQESETNVDEEKLGGTSVGEIKGLGLDLEIESASEQKLEREMMKEEVHEEVQEEEVEEEVLQLSAVETPNVVVLDGPEIEVPAAQIQIEESISPEEDNIVVPEAVLEENVAVDYSTPTVLPLPTPQELFVESVPDVLLEPTAESDLTPAPHAVVVTQEPVLLVVEEESVQIIAIESVAELPSVVAEAEAEPEAVAVPELAREIVLEPVQVAEVQIEQVEVQIGETLVEETLVVEAKEIQTQGEESAPLAGTSVEVVDEVHIKETVQVEATEIEAQEEESGSVLPTSVEAVEVVEVVEVVETTLVEGVVSEAIVEMEITESGTVVVESSESTPNAPIQSDPTPSFLPPPIVAIDEPLATSSRAPPPPPPAEDPVPNLTMTLYTTWNSTSWAQRIPAIIASVAINFGLPFINGVMLGFGELFAKNVIGTRFGWGSPTASPSADTNVRANTSSVGLRAAGARSPLGTSEAEERQSKAASS